MEIVDLSKLEIVHIWGGCIWLYGLQVGQGSWSKSFSMCPVGMHLEGGRGIIDAVTSSKSQASLNCTRPRYIFLNGN